MAIRFFSILVTKVEHNVLVLQIYVARLLTQIVQLDALRLVDGALRSWLSLLKLAHSGPYAGSCGVDLACLVLGTLCILGMVVLFSSVTRFFFLFNHVALDVHR